jgi:hypothetical protein
VSTETPASGLAPDQPPADDHDNRGRVTSGTAFVVVCASLALIFVLFLIFGSPLLLERTRAQAPPPAPQTIASGQVDGRTWSAVAYDGTAHLRGVDEQGIEAVVEEEPCLQVSVESEEAGEICVLRRGGSIRDLGSAAITADGRAVILGIVAPTVTSVTLSLADGSDLDVTPSYVDYGFPLGFFAVDVDAGTQVTGAQAVDRDGAIRATAACEGDDAPGDDGAPAGPVGDCTITEGDY